MHASQTDYKEIAELLLDRGAEVNVPDDVRGTSHNVLNNDHCIFHYMQRLASLHSSKLVKMESWKL